MSESQHASHVVKHAREIIDGMKPLKDKKNPVVAAIIGLLSGAAGVAIYFKSWKDFWVCF